MWDLDCTFYLPSIIILAFQTHAHLIRVQRYCDLWQLEGCPNSHFAEQKTILGMFMLRRILPKVRKYLYPTLII